MRLRHRLVNKERINGHIHKVKPTIVVLKVQGCPLKSNPVKRGNTLYLYVCPYYLYFKKKTRSEDIAKIIIFT